jgi:integrase
MGRQREDVFYDVRRKMWCGRFWKLKQPGKRPPVKDLIEDHPSITREDLDYTYHQMEAALRKKLLGEQGEETEPILFANAASRWIDSLENLLAPRTLTEYKRAIVLWVQINGDHSIKFFDAEANTRFVNVRLSKGASDATVAKDQRSLQVFANWLYDQNLLTRPLRLKKRRVFQRNPSIYSTQQLDALEEELQNKGNEDWLRIFWLARYAVMRSGEIWSLPLANVRLEEGIILVEDVPQLEWTVKTRQQRRIPIGLHLRQLVAADRKRRKPAERWWLDDGHGNPAYASAWALTQVFRRRCAELGIVGPKPLHGIRAAGITKMLLESGGRAELVANVAGHSVAVMLKHYAMITSDDTKGVVDLL